MDEARTRTWQPDWPCPVEQVWGSFKRGVADPTYRVHDGFHWRALNTAAGPATLAVRPLSAAGIVEARAWGPGAGIVLDLLPALLGASDDPSSFRPRHPLLAELHRLRPHWRLGRTAAIWDALVPVVIEQKVTGQEATIGIRSLLARHGQPAPGPGAALRLRTFPTPDAVRAIPSWEWLALHIDPARSRTLVTAARVADTLERVLPAEPSRADERLRSLPGIGVWTSAEIRARALGDADAVSFGDYHVAKDIGWALTGVEVDDDGLAELLEPYRPHRLRVQRLVMYAGLHRPRHGPRMAPRTHLPARRSRT
ncbi:MAG TPA: DNA-3-methyladenine glycosylase 2 family protein [Propionicimonas sp.]|uniref:DNA-3-methyladenine glycosylase family protein n=1 Tax=Propionicimonas sp. TaxID=1955623 RepID=UPI002F42B1AF